MRRIRHLPFAIEEVVIRAPNREDGFRMPVLGVRQHALKGFDPGEIEDVAVAPGDEDGPGNTFGFDFIAPVIRTHIDRADFEDALELQTWDAAFPFRRVFE